MAFTSRRKLTLAVGEPMAQLIYDHSKVVLGVASSYTGTPFEMT
jgi:hypothetical protein